MPTMVYPYTGDKYKKDVEGTGKSEPLGAAVKGSVVGAALALLPWALLALVALYQWLMKAVS